MRLPTSSGPLLVKTNTGGLMGDPFMVHMFGRAFAVPVAAWQLGQRAMMVAWMPSTAGAR